MNLDYTALVATIGVVAVYLTLVLGLGAVIIRAASRYLDRRGPDSDGEYGRTPIGATVAKHIPGGGGW